MITALTVFKSTARGKPEYYLKNSLPTVNHDGPLMVRHSATFPLFSLEQSVLAASTPRSVVDRTPFPGTQARHAQRPLAANATRCATPVDMIALLLGRLGNCVIVDII